MGERNKRWDEGYISELEYTSGYYRELSPQFLNLVALMNGLRSPDAEKLYYCELGCGKGITTNMLAAAMPNTNFYGNDFNPSHIIYAQRLSKSAGLNNVQFYEDSFSEFSENTEIPDYFDYICLHGVYSWVSEENRKFIIEFIKKKLRPGGFVYISYNSLPGLAPLLPLREFLINSNNGVEGSVFEKISVSIQKANEITRIGADYFTKNKVVTDQIRKLNGETANYIAHEYFNKEWQPFYFKEVADQASFAKLNFVASANLLEQIESINFNQDEISYLGTISDSVHKQSIKDYFLDQKFRRDVFAKGAERLSIKEVREHWLKLRFVMIVNTTDVPKALRSRLGNLNLQQDIYSPIIDKFSKGPITLGKALKDERLCKIELSIIIQALSILISLGSLSICLPEEGLEDRKKFTQALNLQLIKKSEFSGGVEFLVSPVTGTGIGINRFEQLFLRSSFFGESTPEKWAKGAWFSLQQHGQKINKEGKIIDSDQENLLELIRQAENFELNRHSIIKNLLLL